MDFEIGVIAVRLACQQRLDLVAIGAVGKGLQRGQPLVDDGFVVLHLAKLDELHGIGHFRRYLVHRADRAFQAPPFAHDLFGLFGIVPQGRILDACVELVETAHGTLPVERLPYQCQCGFDTVDMGLPFGTHRQFSRSVSCAA